MTDSDGVPTSPQVQTTRSDAGALVVHLGGNWSLREALPSVDDIGRELDGEPRPQRVGFDTAGLGSWDSGLLTYLLAIKSRCDAQDIAVDSDGLPDGVKRLLRLALAVPERSGARRSQSRDDLLTRVGKSSLEISRAAGSAVTFLGESILSLGRFCIGRAQIRRSDLVLIIQQSGPQALPIVSLISILVGLILAFVGAIQLKLFGAQIYVANLVAIGMTREMGAMMAAIIMAGRTGAAFAAQLGTMQVNEEIDALRTLGVEPTDFLVLPRMLALILMMPLLCVYAILLGIAGGAIVGVGMLNLPAAQYWHQTIAWLHIGDVMLGVGKATVFGVIIAISGCLRGIECGRSAAAVGAAATSAVVTAIVVIVVVDGLFAVLTNVLGI